MDLLTTSPFLHQIIAVLPRGDLFRCLLLNKRMNSTIHSNWEELKMRRDISLWIYSYQTLHCKEDVGDMVLIDWKDVKSFATLSVTICTNYINITGARSKEFLQCLEQMQGGPFKILNDKVSHSVNVDNIDFLSNLRLILSCILSRAKLYLLHMKEGNYNLSDAHLDCIEQCMRDAYVGEYSKNVVFFIHRIADQHRQIMKSLDVRVIRLYLSDERGDVEIPAMPNLPNLHVEIRINSRHATNRIFFTWLWNLFTEWAAGQSSFHLIVLNLQVEVEHDEMIVGVLHRRIDQRKIRIALSKQKCSFQDCFT